MLFASKMLCRIINRRFVKCLLHSLHLPKKINLENSISLLLYIGYARKKMFRAKNEPIKYLEKLFNENCWLYSFFYLCR